jgi:peptidoglycan/LPS O-acetylase OafA/YrhL
VTLGATKGVVVARGPAPDDDDVNDNVDVDRAGDSEAQTAPGAGAHTGGRWGFSHVPALDGLRGAAVVAVLLYHGGYLEGGYLGVDLFFVLSGYLITSLLLAEERATGTIRLRAFWVRRIRRLVPAVLLVLVGVALYAWLEATPVDLYTIRRDGLATLFYVANWNTILRGVSYWDISLAPSPLQHTWSLAIEEQFYLLWPLVVVGVARLGRAAAPRRLLWLCGGLAVVSAGMFVAFPLLGMSTTRAYEGTDTRATALLLGAAWAAYRMTGDTDRTVRDGRRRRARLFAHSSWTTEVVAIVAVVGLGLAWLGLSGEGRLVYRGGLPLASLLAAVVIAAVADGSSTVLTRAFSWAPLRGIGLISYGLYLWHWPVYLVVDETRTGRDGLALLGLRLAVSLAIAVASYWLVEQPIRRGALRGRLGALALPASMATAAVLVVAATVGAVAPQGGLGAPTVAAVRLPGAPTVMVVGDSVAFSLVEPIARDPEGFGVNPINATWLGCSIVAEHHDRRQFGDDGLQERNLCTERMIDTARSRQPDVVISLIGHRPGYDLRLDGGWVRACQPAFDAEYTATNERFLRGLAGSGATVVAVTIAYPAADAPFMPPGINDLTDCANDALARAVDHVPGVQLLDLNTFVCPRQDCLTEIDGEPVRTDGLHFDQGPAGRRVAEWLLGQSLALAHLEPGR